MPELRSKINRLPEDVRERVVEFINKQIDLSVEDILKDFGKEADSDLSYIRVHCPIDDPTEFINEINKISDGKLIGEECIYDYYYDFIYDITSEIAYKASCIMEDRLGFGVECIDYDFEENLSPCRDFLDTVNVYFEFLPPIQNPDNVERGYVVGDWEVVSADLSREYPWKEYYFEMENKKDPNKRISIECFPRYSDIRNRFMFYACLKDWSMFRGA